MDGALASESFVEYDKSMNYHAKSSFTLPADEIPLVARLKKRLKLKSNTEVIRKALFELEKNIEREKLREQLRAASLLTQDANAQEIEELNSWVDEGLD